MKKLLVIVDMQNDFIDGSLGSQEAIKIVPNVVNKIKNWDGDIITTQDTHYDNYLETSEGKHLPIKHCIEGTSGHEINTLILKALFETGINFSSLNKFTFGSTALPELIRGLSYDYIELVGLCTDICVVSNALILKANYPETEIAVDSNCCAGVTPEKHKAALETMASCQINIL